MRRSMTVLFVAAMLSAPTALLAASQEATLAAAKARAQQRGVPVLLDFFTQT